MNIPSRLKFIATLLLAATLAACSTKTAKPLGEWRSNYFDRKLDNMLIIAVTSRSTRRRVFEDLFVEALASQGIDAVPSYGLITSTLQLSREDIEEAIQGQNLDAVLITRLAAVADKEVYQQPDVERDDLSYFSYYDNAWQQASGGGATQNYRIVALETNVYDTASQLMVFNMRSQVIEATQPRHMIEDQIRLTIDRLRANGLIGE
ncbi:MAG: hypothetical protein QNJ85_18990 [Gammaproteobacteria bacterium]|nr:hypothetical protein [Gammaproteobacteria bacterium]